MTPDASIIIITYNTKELIQECLKLLFQETADVNKQVIVVDNGSSDGTFPALQSIQEIEPIRLEHNVGFGAANNVGYQHANGRYLILLNSDAFPHSDAIKDAIEAMDAHPEVGLAGGRLVGKDGGWQPSARLFPSLLNHLLRITGLADRFPENPFFGRADRTWAPEDVPTETDWVPGAFCIIRREALGNETLFDERFFMYFEEVDLCKRIKNKGWKIQYWPHIVITHLGGETCKSVQNLHFNTNGAQVSKWQTRSALLYFRKHHGVLGIRRFYLLEKGWLSLRWLKNRLEKGKDHPQTLNILNCLAILKQAWHDTKKGTVSPPRPW
jgi:GT2 family glycosyltransferase